MCPGIESADKYVELYRQLLIQEGLPEHDTHRRHQTL